MRVEGEMLHPDMPNDDEFFHFRRCDSKAGFAKAYDLMRLQTWNHTHKQRNEALSDERNSYSEVPSRELHHNLLIPTDWERFLTAGLNSSSGFRRLSLHKNPVHISPCISV